MSLRFEEVFEGESVAGIVECECFFGGALFTGLDDEAK